MRWYMPIVGALLVACGGDFVATYRAPDVSADTATADRATYAPPDPSPVEAGPGRRDTERTVPPCKRNPPADGCPCAYAGERNGVCRSSIRDGVCRRPPAFEPNESICDGLDNDCDGAIDEAAACEAGYRCRSGRCEIDEPAMVLDDYVSFHFQCPEGREKIIQVPRSRIERDGTCWRVTCWYEGRDVAERWCDG